MKMSALLSRNASSRPGITGTARVDRDIDKLLRRLSPGDIAVMDAQDLDRVTADALVEANVAAVVNASSSITGRYPNLGPEVLVANGITLVDETGDDVFKKVKDGARIRINEGGLYSGDRRLALGTERTDADIHELMQEAKGGLVAHLEAFAGNTIEFIRSESPLLIDGIGIPDIDVDLTHRHVVVVAEEPCAAADLKALKPFIKEYQPVLVYTWWGGDGWTAFGGVPELSATAPTATATDDNTATLAFPVPTGPGDPWDYSEAPAGVQQSTDAGVTWGSLIEPESVVVAGSTVTLTVTGLTAGASLLRANVKGTNGAVATTPNSNSVTITET